jgi:hypothetical protein
VCYLVAGDRHRPRRIPADHVAVAGTDSVSSKLTVASFFDDRRTLRQRNSSHGSDVPEGRDKQGDVGGSMKKGTCPSCRKPTRYFLNASRAVCPRCDELLIDIEIECEEEVRVVTDENGNEVVVETQFRKAA